MDIEISYIRKQNNFGTKNNTENIKRETADFCPNVDEFMTNQKSKTETSKSISIFKQETEEDLELSYIKEEPQDYPDIVLPQSCTDIEFIIKSETLDIKTER